MHVVNVPLYGVCGTQIRLSLSPLSKLSLTSLICMAHQNKSDILYTIVLINPGMGLLIGRLGFVLDGATNNMCVLKRFPNQCFC